MTSHTTDLGEERTRGRRELGIPGITATAKLGQWWKPKAANLLGVLYAVVAITELPVWRAFFLLIPAVITILGIGSFGHAINDWYDTQADALAGKANRLANITGWKRYGLMVGILAMALLPWLVLPFDGASVALLLLEFALLLAYVMPPVRLKERRIWPLFADAAYAYAVPAVLAAHTFFLAKSPPSDSAFLGLLCLWQLSLGVRHFLNHIALDRTNDIATATPTLATQKGNRFIHGLIRRFVLPVELIAFLGYLLIMSRYVTLLVPIVAGLFLVSASLHAVLTVGRGYPLIPYRFSRSHVDRLCQDILPLVLLSFLVLRDWRFSLLLGVHVILFYATDGSAPLGRWLIHSFSHLRVLAWPAMMLVGDLQPVKRARLSPTEPEAESARVPDATHVENTKRGSNIAIVNINKGKYTETFVQGLIPRLHYKVYYLYGGELPTFDDDGRHFLSNWPSLQALAHFLEIVLRLEERHFLRNSIASYLQAKQIKLILAEFGPVGVEMLPIAKDLGIPLVVYFHAYDVFHKQTLGQYASKYVSLFREAACIVGVSKIVLNRLEDLGAAKCKLVHLPAFVNLELFSYSNHSGVAPRFLAVGRFAETKSPHLTILAFQRVAQVIPQASLTLVGKGGGGELFEACLILVRSLRLEHCVEFKGILSHEDVAIEMRRARVFVQHSVTTPENGDMEGKPVAVMEAMASGLPVVATRHSGIPELIEHGVTGLLVAEYDIEAMANAMIRLAKDDDLVSRMGRSASEAIHDHPLISRNIEALEKIIDSSIAQG
jgi:colanic acid/amylovoran biosynthesis glycosyltransferase